LATPTLSVAAPQLSCADVSVPVAVSVPGALGGVVSGFATDLFMSLWISVGESARL
jgi:hypothetical protein